MARHVLEPSNAFRQQHVDVFDFVYPAIAALWNMRFQVHGYLSARPDADATELRARFVTGSGLNYRNVRGAFVESTWDEQLQQFARVVLVNLVALYEAWVEDVVRIVPGVPDRGRSLQFPSAGFTGRQKPGVGEALAAARAAPSALMQRAFTDPLRRGARYHLTHLDDMFVVYRYFKEVRNAIVHANGVVPAYGVQAYTDLAGIGDAGLGKTGPLHGLLPPLTAGRRVSISVPEIATFSELLLRIVTTLDAEFAATTAVEDRFAAAWTAQHADRFSSLAVPRPLRDPQLTNLVVALNYPEVRPADDLRALLEARGLIRPR